MQNLKESELHTTSRVVDKVLELEKPHEKIEYDYPIKIYYADAIYSGNDNQSWFYVVKEDVVVGNPLRFPSRINSEDVIKIAQDLLQEYLSYCDFEGLNEGWDWFSCPSHINGYLKTKEKWQAKYGKGSKAHLQLIKSRVGDLISEYNFNFDETIDKQEILEQMIIKEGYHGGNK